MEEILSFLKMEFSKPIYQFLIQQNSIKTYELIGRGGTSSVFFGNYRGTDVAIKKIKIKEINDNYFKEYKNEIVALTMIRHPNLIIFMGTMLEDNNLCIVTEYCKGGTLFDLLHKKKNINLPWNLRLRILIDISKAMNFLHTNNPQIIHSDLKSLNILMTDEIKENSENNNVSIKITDFGLSKIIDKDKIIWESPQGIVGSVQWMAPEVLQNNCTDNTKVDIYSFGIIIWEICTRIQPYKDMSAYQIINYVCNENGRPDINLLPLAQMPKGLLELMENCWNTDPNLRPDFSSALLTLNDMLSLDG
jgi:serine/threonine protein kinase